MVSYKRICGLCLMLVGLLLLSCAPTPTPTPTAKPAPKPTPTPAAKPAVATPTPAAKPTPAPSPSPTPAPAKATLQWFGHSTYLLTSSAGTKVLIDPMGEQVGYTIPTLKGVDVVTVSHEHADHNNLAMAADSPTVLRGLSDKEWARIDQAVKGVKIRTVGTFHDDKEGAQRGRNAVFMFEVDGMTVAHLGDLGHELTPAQVSAVGPVDVLMIPVGGYYTIDAAAATKVVGQLSPKVVIPMHYKTPKTPTSPVSPPDDFLKDKKVERPNTNIYGFTKATLPQTTTVIVLNYE